MQEVKAISKICTVNQITGMHIKDVLHATYVIMLCKR